MNDRRRGVLYLIAANAVLSPASALVRLAGDLPTPQKIFFRCLVMAMVSCAIMLKKRIPFRLEKRFAAPVLLRGVTGTASFLLNFYALDHLALADANTLNKLSPFFMVVFSALILKEKIRPSGIAALAAAFIGALFIIKPGGSGVQLIPAVAGAMGGVLSGLAFTYVRAAGKAGAPKELVVFSLSLVSCLTMLPYVALNFVPMTLGQCLCLLGCGAFSSAGHILNTRAYACAPGNQISVFDYSQVVFTAVLGFIMFGQIPDALSAVGYCIVIGTGIAVFLGERRRKKETASAGM